MSTKIEEKRKKNYSKLYNPEKNPFSHIPPPPTHTCAHVKHSWDHTVNLTLLRLLCFIALHPKTPDVQNLPRVFFSHHYLVLSTSSK